MHVRGGWSSRSFCYKDVEFVRFSSFSSRPQLINFLLAKKFVNVNPILHVEIRYTREIEGQDQS